MTEQAQVPEADRLAAHERLSTGALARWMRACANHTVARRPRLAGDHRRADRARRHRRRQPQGRVRDPGLGHAEGDRPDRGRVRLRAGLRAQPRLRRARGRAARHARAQGRDRGGGREAQDVRVQAERRTRPGSTASATRSARTRSRTTAGSRTRRPSSSRDRYAKDRDAVVAVQDAVRKTVEPAGVTVEFNGEAESPPIQQGIQELLGFLAAFIVLLIVFRTLVATAIPIALAHRRRRERRSSCSSSSPG